MSGSMIAIYRVPLPRAAQVGRIRVVKDRKQRYYVDGTPVSSSATTGEYTVLECADGATYYVLTAELGRVPGPRGT
jgi:hypothetical protein